MSHSQATLLLEQRIESRELRAVVLQIKALSYIMQINYQLIIVNHKCGVKRNDSILFYNSIYYVISVKKLLSFVCFFQRVPRGQ